MKTDIWTNHPNPQFLNRCKPNNPDCNHIRNPRGKTQKEMGVYSEWSKLASRPLARGIIPTKLIEHIVDICEERNKS